MDYVHPIGSTYVQYPGQLSPNTLWGAVSVWREIDYKGVFFRAKGNGVKSDGTTPDGNNANAFSSSVNGGVQQEGLPNITGSIYSAKTTDAFAMINILPESYRQTGALYGEDFSMKSRGGKTDHSSYGRYLKFNANLSNPI